jgi:glycine hydroxymethyltransferase
MDFWAFRVVADDVGAILLADISHPSGLIAKGLLNDPYLIVILLLLQHTKHCVVEVDWLWWKDFENPFGLTTQREWMIVFTWFSCFPGNQGGTINAHHRRKSSCFWEALQDEFFTYALQLQKNANAMAEAFVKRAIISSLEELIITWC